MSAGRGSCGGLGAHCALGLAATTPFERRTWQRSIALHTVVGFRREYDDRVVIEAALGWLAARPGIPVRARHTSFQHLQLYCSPTAVLIARRRISIAYRSDFSRPANCGAARLEDQLWPPATKSLCAKAQLQPQFLFNTLHAAVGTFMKDPVRRGGHFIEIGVSYASVPWVE